MTPKRLKWQKFSGYVLPILAGWVMIIWAFACTIWLTNYSPLADSELATILILVFWFVLFPFMGYVMGIVNSLCWRNQNLGANEANDTMTAIGLFWLFTFPLTIVMICSVIGFVGFLFHMTFFWLGQEKGTNWLASDTIDKFLGKKNDWERNEQEQS